MAKLSVIVPARNEVFLARTINDILENAEGDTEVIAILDGYWPDPVIVDNKRVVLVHYSESIGQRAATNIGVRLSKSKYIMKVDAHCAFDKGFDVKLMGECDYDWVVVPRMYNLHAFDLVCKCGELRYQGPTKIPCKKCGGTDFERDMLWKPRLSRRSDFYRFDKDLKFQYWQNYERRPEAQGDIADTMSLLGACFFCHRKRFWDLGWLDEAHGSWGQMGTEMACKSWLSGGRLVVNKRTWFAHMFRTQGADFGFPYKLSNDEVDRARNHSKDLWLNDKWRGAKRKLQWLLDKFAPVPGWGV